MYAPELRLLGAVNAVPAANISGYAQMAEGGAMTPIQSAAYVAMLITRPGSHSDFDADQYRRGSVKTELGRARKLQGSGRAHRAALQVKPDELKPATHEATLKLQANLQALAVPQRKADAPMLRDLRVGKDEYINPAWTKRGDRGRLQAPARRSTSIVQEDKSHNTFDASRASTGCTIGSTESRCRSRVDRRHGLPVYGATERPASARALPKRRSERFYRDVSARTRSAALQRR